MFRIDFSGQTALVTGASRGIGKQIAKDLANSGARLIVTSTKGMSDAELNENFGSEAKQFVVDFLSPESTARFITSIRKLERLDVCINNAGLSRHNLFPLAKEADFDETIQADLKAPFLVMQAAAEVMSRRKYGRIVNITSVLGHLSAPEKGMYTAAKFGLRGMSMNAAIELARHNVLVNCIAPGPIITDMLLKNYTEEQRAQFAQKLPIGRLGEVQEVSPAVLFLASGLNTFITGQSLPVDGGFTAT